MNATKTTKKLTPCPGCGHWTDPDELGDTSGLCSKCEEEILQETYWNAANAMSDFWHNCKPQQYFMTWK